MELGGGGRGLVVSGGFKSGASISNYLGSSIKGQTQTELKRWPCSCGRVKMYPIERRQNAPMTHSSQASSLWIQPSAASREK